MKKLRVIALTVAVLVLAGYVYLRFGTRTVPDGQPPLATMELTSLRESFNAATGATRVIVLLSPT